MDANEYMKWECCWTNEVVGSDGCPYIMDNEGELRFSLKRRLQEKCLECPRFDNDLNNLASTEPSLSRVLRYLTAEFLDQKRQIQYMAGFLNTRNREIQFLHEIGIVLQTSMELDEVLSVAMTAITAGKGFGLNRAFLLLTDDERQNLTGYLGVGPRSFQEAWQIWEEIGRSDSSLREMARHFHDTKLSSEKVKFQDILEQLTIPLSDHAHILNRALFNGKPVLVTDAFHNSDVDPELARILGVDTFLILPLLSRKRRIGVIIADNFITHKPITVQDMESMETLSFPVAFAIERASLYSRLHQELEKLTEANIKLKEQQELIVKMEKMALVGKITSSVAHSIRNPLMIIGGFARSLKKSMGENDPKRNYIESILAEARKLEDALTEVLGYADSLFPAMDIWNVNELAANVCGELKDKMEAQGIACSFDLEKSLPMAFIDYKQIAFCLRKIISNAMEAMPDGGAITVSTRMEEACMVLEIRDTSKTLTHSVRDFMSASSFTDREQISALSVSLCKMILEKNALSFQAEMSAEGGIRYTIKLPVKKEETPNE
jgi:signal transduction histidine kinase